jgi:hypothetical protein
MKPLQFYRSVAESTSIFMFRRTFGDEHAAENMIDFGAAVKPRHARFMSRNREQMTALIEAKQNARKADS